MGAPVDWPSGKPILKHRLWELEGWFLIVVSIEEIVTWSLREFSGKRPEGIKMNALNSQCDGVIFWGNDPFLVVIVFLAHLR